MPTTLLVLSLLMMLMSWLGFCSRATVPEMLTNGVPAVPTAKVMSPTRAVRSAVSANCRATPEIVSSTTCPVRLMATSKLPAILKLLKPTMAVSPLPAMAKRLASVPVRYINKARLTLDKRKPISLLRPSLLPTNRLTLASPTLRVVCCTPPTSTVVRDMLKSPNKLVNPSTTKVTPVPLKDCSRLCSALN